MSFAKLEKALLAETKQRVNDVIRKHETEYKSEEQRIATRARQLEEDLIAKAHATGEMEARRVHQVAGLKARADILVAKQEALDKVKSEAIAKVLGWNKAQTTELLAGLLELLPDEPGNLIAGSQHAALVRQLAGKTKWVIDEQTINDDGGLVYQGKLIELNLTVGSLIAELFDREKVNIAAKLFAS